MGEGWGGGAMKNIMMTLHVEVCFIYLPTHPPSPNPSPPRGGEYVRSHKCGWGNRTRMTV
jgi:hypothetical protein